MADITVGNQQSSLTSSRVKQKTDSANIRAKKVQEFQEALKAQKQQKTSKIEKSSKIDKSKSIKPLNYNQELDSSYSRKSKDLTNLSRYASENGMDLATLEKLRETAKKMEKLLQSQMWRGAIESVQPDEGDKTVSMLFNGPLIDQLIEKALGEEGGDVADNIFANLVTQYEVFLKKMSEKDVSIHEKTVKPGSNSRVD